MSVPGPQSYVFKKKMVLQIRQKRPKVLYDISDNGFKAKNNVRKGGGKENKKSRSQPNAIGYNTDQNGRSIKPRKGETLWLLTTYH